MHRPAAAKALDLGRTISLCRQALHPPELAVVGASTGGPTALLLLLSALKPSLARIPVCVTLHMPPELMPAMAAHVASSCEVPVKIVTQRCALEHGSVYFASGDRCLTIIRSGTRVDVVPRAKGALEGTSAIDVMFASAAKSHGRRVIGVVLSGMGKDGLAGARAVVAAGGTVLVQDEESSAVWGMPGAVAEMRLAAAILQPGDIAKEITRRLEVSGQVL